MAAATTSLSIGPRASLGAAVLRSDAFESFVGRSRELSLIEKAIASGYRVVTLYGAAGIGKTELALRHARFFADSFRCCDLSLAGSLVDVCLAAAKALGRIPRASDCDALVAEVGRMLRELGEHVFVLDDAASVATDVVRALTAWRAVAPETVFVVTSRALLRLDGERGVEVGPLSHDEALELFEMRARRWRASPFDVAERRLASSMVGRLNGSPLTVERAASRLAIHSLSELAENLGERVDLSPSPSHRTTSSEFRIGAEAMWYGVAHTRTDLSRRPLLRKLLLALVSLHENAPGTATKTRELIRICWPGERIAAGPARNRLYVAIATLRRFGLRDLIANERGGYMLRPGTVVQWET